LNNTTTRPSSGVLGVCLISINSAASVPGVSASTSLMTCPKDQLEIVSVKSKM